MPEGRHILARVVLAKQGDAYVGEVPLYGFAYGVEIRKHADGVELIVWDGLPVGAYRIPAVDGAA